LLFFVSSAHYLTSSIVHCHLLPDDRPHVVKPDCLAEFNDFGSDRDYLVPSIINRAGELIPDVYAKAAAWVQNPMTFLPDKTQVIYITLISLMVSDLIVCPVIFKLPVWGWRNDQMNRFIGHQIHLSGIAMNYFVYGFHFWNLL
jgi:hypothetical protein